MARDDVWVQIVILIRLVPDLVAEAVAACEDPEDVLAEMQPDLDAINAMADDPGAPWPFGPFAHLLRVIRDRTDAPPGLLARLQAFEDAFWLLRDVAAHERLPGLADETP
jgi:hypothetical protein